MIHCDRKEPRNGEVSPDNPNSLGNSNPAKEREKKGLQAEETAQRRRERRSRKLKVGRFGKKATKRPL